MKIKKTLLAAALTAGLFSAANIAKADVVIFDNGLPVGNSNRCNSGPNSCGGTGSWTIYDNFTLAAAATITGFANWNLGNSSNINDYGSTNWSIWSVTPYNGGSALYSGNSLAAVSSDLGFIKTSVSGLSLNLSAGTYWLGINHQLTSPLYYASWTYASSSGGSGDAIQLDGGSWTFTNQPNLAFYVTASETPPVPEPETYAMLLVGLGLLSFTAKRRKQST